MLPCPHPCSSDYTKYPSMHQRKSTPQNRLCWPISGPVVSRCPTRQPPFYGRLSNVNRRVHHALPSYSRLSSIAFFSTLPGLKCVFRRAGT